MKNILVIGTGGTIASVRDGEVIRLDNPFIVTEYEKRADVNFICLSPFSVLSENMSVQLIFKLLDFIRENAGKYDGTVVLHGSDTLAFTSAFVGNAFDSGIVLTASNKPIGEHGSNGIENFRHAVDYLLNGGKEIAVSYDGIFPATSLVSANDEDKFICINADKRLPDLTALNDNVLIIEPYPGIDYDFFELKGVGAVIHKMYHSATVPDSAKAFYKKCRDRGIPFYFVTSKPSADYETADGIENIIFNCTAENLYAKLILKNKST